MTTRQKRLRKRPPAGARPGTLAVTRGEAPPATILRLYDPGGVEERDLDDPEAIASLKGGPKRFWLDVTGLGDAEYLGKLGGMLEIHPLALEDIVHVPQRPKAEEYEKHLLLISEIIRVDGQGRPEMAQLSLVVGPGYLVSFRERPSGCLDPVVSRLRDGKGPMRGSGPDYLAYAIVDAVVDGYFGVVEAMSERIESLERRILDRPLPEHLSELQHLKEQQMAVRRAVWSQRDALSRLMREPGEFIGEKVRVYLRDVLDHCTQIIEVCDSQRELLGGLMNMHLSVVGNRMNEVMKVLTVMASIFIPLTFLAGIYGMNFQNMPELGLRWAYPALLAVMAATVAGMLLYFRRKGWIGSRKGRSGDGR